ncbi:exopolygalacturonase clone GBGE184-like [Dendrobium catenatum]|uniref:exopolygalacturonase clone GBGE184-like n=1 Tax=Dendrobium catenatum TaxID=906689 RepID=UPI00109FFEB1|nr:exopolygalacturonase clone GBGE184-like [Dendrobium catenatum]
MDSKILLSLLVLIVARENSCCGQNFTEKMFDVTSYGACPEGKNNSVPAFLKAWSEACSTDCGLLGRAKVLIPEGTFLIGPVSFQGLCKSAMVVEVNGVILAPTDLQVFRKEWIAFRRVNGLLITGSGKINGQGATAWQKKKKGSRLPPYACITSSRFRTSHRAVASVCVLCRCLRFFAAFEPLSLSRLATARDAASHRLPLSLLSPLLLARVM